MSFQHPFRLVLVVLASSIFVLRAQENSPAPQLTDVLFKNLKVRAIGPAVMGGRVSDIAIDPRNPSLFYVGLATGGLFKSGDNGITFDPIFDKEAVQSIGAVAALLTTAAFIAAGKVNVDNIIAVRIKKAAAGL